MPLGYRVPEGEPAYTFPTVAPPVDVVAELSAVLIAQGHALENWERVEVHSFGRGWRSVLWQAPCKRCPIVAWAAVSNIPVKTARVGTMLREVIDAAAARPCGA